MNAADDNGPDFTTEREMLFAEIETLRGQRNGLMVELAACRRECRELQAELRRLRGEP